MPFLDNGAIHMPYRSDTGAASGGEACQHIERLISSTVKKIPQTATAEPTGKAIKSNNNVCSTMKRQSGLMIDYYYIKQKCGDRGGLPCWDYFGRIKDARVLARDCHGWHQEASSSTILQEKLFLRIKDHTRYCGKRVPPLFLGADGETTTLNNQHKPWREVWEKMLQSGWTWQPETGLMMDNFYIINDSNKCQCSLSFCIQPLR
jgi:hypothetical protein